MFFFVFWGKKRTEKELGYAADYCPVCRKITGFIIYRVTLAAHVYYVATEEGQFLGHTQVCLPCRTTFDCTTTRFHSLSNHASQPIEELTAETFPSIYEKFAEQLAIEERVSFDPHALEPDLRKKLIHEPFQLAASYFEHQGRESGLKILVTALHPLDPSEDEIRECLNHFRRIHARMGFMIRTSTVMRELKSQAIPKEYDY